MHFESVWNSTNKKHSSANCHPWQALRNSYEFLSLTVFVNLIRMINNFLLNLTFIQIIHGNLRSFIVTNLKQSLQIKGLEEHGNRKCQSNYLCNYHSMDPSNNNNKTRLIGSNSCEQLHKYEQCVYLLRRKLSQHLSDKLHIFAIKKL